MSAPERAAKSLKRGASSVAGGSTSTDVPSAAARVQRLRPSIFAEMTGLAVKNNAVNLGQGVPNWAPPAFVLDALRSVIDKGASVHQYTHPQGYPALREGLAEVYGKRFGQTLTAANVVITNGAQEAIYSSMQALVNTKDAVCLVEPSFDTYSPDAVLGGGRPVSICLSPDDELGWCLDPRALEAVFEKEKPKVFLLNNPHNPCGRVFTRKELEPVAALCVKYDVTCIADEIYDQITFDGREFVHMCTLPGMADRTLTISSFSKTFSVTGWKVGYCLGPERLVAPIARLYQYMPYCVCAPMQVACSLALKAAENNGHYDKVKADYQERRDVLLGWLKKAGIPAQVPEGAYFIMSDVTDHEFSQTADGPSDVAFAKRLVSELKVACIPASILYSSGAPGGRQFVRWSFSKDIDTLIEGGKRLAKQE